MVSNVASIIFLDLVYIRNIVFLLIIYGLVVIFNERDIIVIASSTVRPCKGEYLLLHTSSTLDPEEQLLTLPIQEIVDISRSCI